MGCVVKLKGEERGIGLQRGRLESTYRAFKQRVLIQNWSPTEHAANILKKTFYLLIYQMWSTYLMNRYLLAQAGIRTRDLCSG